ncbi:MAG TPA: anthranilate synthase component I [bacterium]|uniref:Anthranilate synthase component 1 n=1 Tax=candidate division TA06 bacterium ADurb.Bin417 TaxID=1852828 RepID=A0A1V5MKA0_UNCT6|nr:MAG: Anthranilate synthase component 1 [candidate division TA06 bacterium ADurb.Bin417]HNQ35010.1 anthranilate synthase component I [bacterium]HNS48549.1 anthranilate synthase component I [bacterium]
MEITPSFDEFRRLARDYNLVPLSVEILADLETPVSAYWKVVGARPGFLLESVEGGEKQGRYSFLGTDASLIISAVGDRVSLDRRGRVETRSVEPLLFLRDLMSGFRVAPDPGLPPFSGGLVGYCSYDLVRRFERIPDRNPDDLGMPDFQFFLADTLLAFDHFRHRLRVITHAEIDSDVENAYRKAVLRLESIAGRLRKTGTPYPGGPASASDRFRMKPDWDRKDFEAAVRRAKSYIRRGDAIQVVLSQRLAIDFPGSGANQFNLYRAIRSINPSPYLFHLNFGPFSISGSSPEVMVRLEADRATLRPIAGTRPRGADEVSDLALERELRRSRKEQAEHIMLVDLGRNDLGRVCRPGSVKVTELMSVERYSHVMHLVSNITGRLVPGRDALDLFQACFPAGTVSGAPKVRAMEIIDELEQKRRGPYAGAVGYLDFAGNLDTCITIRTVLVKGGRAYLQVGAGIVADSDPGREYEETMNKGRALLESLRLVLTGQLC